MTNNPPEFTTLPTTTFQAILDNLAIQPYAQVAALVNQINADLAAASAQEAIDLKIIEDIEKEP